MALGDFSPQAAAYSRSRPGYPPELLNRLIEVTGIRPGEPVVDLGAGTGLFTRLLAERGFHGTAIEPNADMRRHAERFDSVRWLDGTFENTGLPDGSQCWAVAAQSFHWGDSVRALPELRRILQRPGWLTVLWNNRDNERSDLLAWTVGAIERYVPGFEQSYRDRDRPPSPLYAFRSASASSFETVSWRFDVSVSGDQPLCRANLISAAIKRGVMETVSDDWE